MVTFEELAQKKVPLEFGNQEQIQAIDRETLKRQEVVERARMEEDCENCVAVLRVYTVEFALSGTASVQVVAYDEEEARQKARDEFRVSDMDIDDYDIVDVYPIRRVS
jgi:hypothetical protein